MYGLVYETINLIILLKIFLSILTSTRCSIFESINQSLLTLRVKTSLEYFYILFE